MVSLFVFLPVCLSICLSDANPSVRLSLCLSVHSSLFPLDCLSVFLSAHLYFCVLLSVCLSIRLSIHPLVHSSFYPFVFLYIHSSDSCLSVFLFVYLSYMSLCFSVCLSQFSYILNYTIFLSILTEA
jgi:hypothetical protein